MNSMTQEPGVLTSSACVKNGHASFIANDMVSAVIQVAPSAIVVVDLTGLVTLWNETAARIFGVPEEQVLNRPLSLLAPQDGSKRHEILELIELGQSTQEVLLECRKADGSPMSLSVSAVPLPDADGRISGAVLAIENITQERRVEAQLLKAQRLESVGRLAGGIAHDFNNLLSVINGYADLVLTKLDKHDPFRESIKEIRSAGGRATTLTKQLLAFSRQQVLQPKAINLNSVVDDIGAMLRRLIGENIQLSTFLCPSLGSVMADPGQIQQVLMNLVLNARDAIPGGGEIVIETENVDLDEQYCASHDRVEPGPHVMLAVSDTGVGMDAETRNRAFEPFFTTKEAGHGTGLGLATVYGIVRQSKGWTWVYSEPGRGTTFKIYLPRLDRIIDTPEGATEDVRKRLGSGETILVVEDNHDVRRLVEGVLRNYSYRVLSATTGAEAILLCERQPDQVHLLLSDVAMQGMTGPELARRLRTLMPNMKVLFMSGYASSIVARHGVAVKESAFLEKPFTPVSLTAKIREVLCE